jgi:hypothetical protein
MVVVASTAMVAKFLFVVSFFFWNVQSGRNKKLFLPMHKKEDRKSSSSEFRSSSVRQHSQKGFSKGIRVTFFD